MRREDLMKYSTEQLYAQYTVCANHFEDSQFMNPAQKNRLIHNAENLFSIIRGKGGFWDNPDASQFKEAFKYVVADKLFVQSGKSNCKIDNDKILLDISNVAVAKYIKPVPRNVEKPPTTDVALLITPPLSLPTKNVPACLAGYILQKISVN